MKNNELVEKVAKVVWSKSHDSGGISDIKYVIKAALSTAADAIDAGEGDEVVTAGASFLTEGQEVRAITDELRERR